MNNMTVFLTGMYALLLRLYPPKFRFEFEEQMLQDFSDFLNEAEKKGKFAVLQFCMRELVDFPVNLLKVHYREGELFQKFRSEPANHAVRGALGFSAGFAFLSIATYWLGGLVYPVLDLIVDYLFAGTQNAFINDVLLWVPLAAYSVLTSLTFGLLLACFLGSRSNFWTYVFAGAFSWLIPEILSYVLVNSLGFEYYRNEPFTSIVGYSMLILMGAFFSRAYSIAEHERKRPPLYLFAVILIYPLATYLFIGLLFNVWHEVTPGFFTALIFFLIALVIGVIVIAMPINSKQYLPVLAGAIGYFLLNRAMFYIAYHTPGFSLVLEMGVAPDVLNLPLYHMVMYKGTLGALFAFVLGFMAGYQNKNNRLLIVAED